MGGRLTQNTNIYIYVYYESQLCWAELPRLLNEVKNRNTGGEWRFRGC